MSSSFLPLNAKQDVRPGTRNPGTFDSTLINSSVIPSLKYSSFLSALMFTNGSTAIDFCEIDDAAAVVDLARGLLRKRLNASRPAASNATTITNVANFRRLQVGNFAATSCGTSSVR